MKKKIYHARKSGVLKDKDAQVVGETLEGLRNKEGHLKTENVVMAAKQKKSPLHNYFEWNDTVSAQAFRLQQARNLINSVAEHIIIQEKVEPTKSFYSVQKVKGEDDDESEGRFYVIVQDAIGNEDYRKQLLSKIISTLENLTITMKMFKEHDIK